VKVRTIAKILGLLAVGAGLVLGTLGFVGWDPLMGQMEVGSSREPAASLAGEGTDAPSGLGPTIENADEEPEAAGAPEDKTLTLTVPKMARIENDAVPDAAGDDEEALKNSASIHLQGTGFPWQEEANVYIAGHRLGYPGEPSFLAFWDLDVLENGDEVFLTDANGEEYTYRVFKEFEVDPTDLYVTETIPDKNIVTLQTCTLPDYSRRLIVQAELVEKT